MENGTLHLWPWCSPTLQVKVFTRSPFGNQLFWFRETFLQIKLPAPKFRCHRNQNGQNLEDCSLNFFCVRATKQPAMQATFLLELFKNIKSLNDCIVLSSLYKFIKLSLIYHCFLPVSATIQGEFRVSCTVQTMLEPGSQPSEITCSELTEKCYCSSLSKQGKLATFFTVPIVAEV